VRIKGVPFSLILPLIELAVWAMLVPVPAMRLYQKVHGQTRGMDQVRLYSGQFTAIIPQGRLFNFLLERVAYGRSHFHFRLEPARFSRTPPTGKVSTMDLSRSTAG
jgi:hypothetical protein